MAGITDNANTNWEIYPNPYSLKDNLLTIKEGFGQFEVLMNIISLDGKLVKSVQFYSKDGLHYESSAIDLVDGMYRIQNAELGFTLPLIIQN